MKTSNILTAVVTASLTGLIAIGNAQEKKAETTESPANAEEKKIDLQQVPESARQAAMKAAGQTKLTEGFVEREEGRDVYELRGKDAQGEQIEVDVTADGKVLEIEREIAMDTVPQAVKEALQQKVQGFKPRLVEASSDPQGEVQRYEFEGKNQKGQEIDVEIDKGGKEVEIEVETQQ